MHKSALAAVRLQSVKLRKALKASVTLFLAALSLLVAPAASAQNRERSGMDVVGTVCCHQTGAKGAPRIGDEKAWSKLAPRSLSDLTESALKGIRNMPAHGGNMTLTDIEIERAITYMVNRSGGKWTEPVSGLTPAVERRGEQVVQAQCAKCHQSGVNGVPRIGDRGAWVPRLKRGLDLLVRSAINGHGPMLPRGGMSELTDSEIRGAVVYMYNPGSVSATAPAAALPAAPAHNHKLLSGTEIFLGIVSVDSMHAKYAKGGPESLMHGDMPRGKDYYHLTSRCSTARREPRSPMRRWRRA